MSKILKLTNAETQALSDAIVCKLMFIKGDVGRSPYQPKPTLSTEQMKLVIMLEALNDQLTRP